MLADIIRQASCLQFFTYRGSALVLPDDGRVDRYSLFPIPYNSGLALVGDCNGCNGGCRNGMIANYFMQNVFLRGPDLFRVVLHPSRPGKELGEFLLGRAGNLSPFIDKKSARTSGTLIEGDDVFHFTQSIQPKNT